MANLVTSNESLMRRMRAEYLEMPGLQLTPAQAQRLWSAEPKACARAIKALVDEGFLRLTSRGTLVVREDGYSSVATPAARAGRPVRHR